MTATGGSTVGSVPEPLVRLGTPRRYPAGSLLFAEGDPQGSALIVTSGQVEVRTTAAGRIGSVGPGEMVGELSAVDGLPRSASARATTAVTATAVTPIELAALMAADPAVRRHVTAVIGSRTRTAGAGRGPAGQGLPVEDLARWVLDRRVVDDEWIELSLDEVTDDLGCSRELLSRSIDHLVGRGMIALDRGRLLVRSVTALQALVAAGARPAPGWWV